jgi:hypothetical protein
MKSQKGVTAGGIFLVWLIVVLFLAIGWIMNIVAVIQTDLSHVTTLLIVRIIGIIVVPLGSFLGWFF